MSDGFVRRWHTTRPETRTKNYISSVNIKILVNEQLRGKLASRFGIYTADAEYYCTPLADAQEIILASTLDRKTWVQERFDCDDFAHVLKAHFAEAAYADGRRRAAHCFGIVWGMLPGHHAINWMVNDDYKLRFVEPQNDQIYFPRENDRDIYFMLI